MMKSIQLFLLSSVSIFLLNSCCSTYCYKGKPAKTITVEQAEMMENEWIRTRAKAINDALGRPDDPDLGADPREFHYSLEELKNYMAYVEHEAKKLGIAKEHLGLRIYFAAYNDSLGFGAGNHATIFITPTERGNGESRSPEYDNIQSIEPLNMAQGGQPPKNYSTK